MPIGLVALVWQAMVIPALPPTEAVSPRRMLGLLSTPKFALGMAATGLAFMGTNALSIYLRPFLESVTGLDVAVLSLALLSIGVGGLAGLGLVGLLLARHLNAALVGIPAVLAVLALLLMALGPLAGPTLALLVLWGLVSTPIPVIWNTWMAAIIPNDLEAGGGLQVALIQTAIAGGALSSGLLFDLVGWWASFSLSALLLSGAAIFAHLATPRR